MFETGMIVGALLVGFVTFGLGELDRSFERSACAKKANVYTCEWVPGYFKPVEENN